MRALLLICGLALIPLCVGRNLDAQVGVPQEEKDIFEIAASDPNLSKFMDLAISEGMTEGLNGNARLTLFIPSNRAFLKMPVGEIRELLKQNNRDALVELLGYHVVPGEVVAEDFYRVRNARTLQGNSIRLSVKESGTRETLMVNGARVTQSNIFGRNGVIHVIDRVLIPGE